MVDIASGQIIAIDLDGDGKQDMEFLVGNSGLAGGAADFAP